MVLAALLVPATIWWMSMRYYYTHRQAERALALQQHAQQQAAAVKQKSSTFFRPVDSGSVEFVQPHITRTSWNGQTDPDGVWHDQRLKANKTLMDHGLPALNKTGLVPDSPPVPSVRRLNRF